MTIDPATVRTYAPGSWSVTLCLATRWFGDDPCPTVCGREEHEDPWHVSAKYSTTSEPVTWEDE